VLGVLRVEAVLLGLASGVLASGILFYLLVVLARAAQSETLAGLALTLAVLLGMAVAGVVAGRMARVNGRFHGSITALVLAGVVVVVSSLGGSPTPLGAVLLLAVAAIIVGGVAGTIAFNRRRHDS
jgi:putative membrane protein (TIGR04086 family)